MSDEQKVQVAIEANIASLMQGLSASQEKVASSTAAMKTSVESMAVGMNSGFMGITQQLEHMGAKFEILQGGLSKITGAFMAVGAVLAGGEIFEKMVGHTAELAEHLEVVSQKTGLTTQEIQKLDYAAKMCEVSAETLEKAMQRLAMNMQASVTSSTGPAAIAFQNLGIKVQDSEGKLRPINDVMMDLAERFKDMPNGTQKTADAMAIFGRAGADMIPFLNKGRDGIKDLGDEAEKLGVVMNGEAIDASLAYSESMKKIKAQAEGLMQKLAVELMPSLQALAQMFTTAGQSGSSLGLVLDGLGITVKIITTGVLGLKMVFDLIVVTIQTLAEMAGDVFDGLVKMVKTASENFSNLGKVIKDVLHGNFADAATAAKDMQAKMDQAITETAQNLVADGDKALDKLLDKSVETQAAMKALWADPIKPKIEGGAGDAGDPNQKKAKPPKDRLAALREELKEMEDARADDNQMSKAEITAYWKNILDTEKLSAKERIEVFHQYVAERRAAEKEQATAAKAAAKQAEEVAKLQDEGELAHAKAGLEQKKALLAAQVAAHQITGAQALTIERQFLDQEYGLELAALTKKLNLMAQEPVKRQQVLNQIRAMEDKYRLDKEKLDAQAAKKEETLWDQMYRQIGRSAQMNIDAMINGQENFAGAAKSITKSVAMDYLHMGEQMLEEWIMRMITGTAASKTAASAEISANAGVAATAAMASVAAIPIVGWAMAPGVGAATEALAMSYQVAASAAGGYDIPAGVNPVTQLHQREMVLPAEHADTIRGMKGRSGGGDTYHINALDAPSVERLLRRNGAALASGMRSAQRNGFLRR